ncbi:hypothetical protein [Kocuria palustris]|uniref:hypothetical protein n=1 Tax=Kocuria palustris TaxID=71999 RepID=UPI002301294B|nr:hypothetical protein [Kocuria palustris]
MAYRTQVLGLLADPGVPQKVTDALAGRIAEQLTRRTGTPWETEVSHVTFPLNDDGTVPFSDRAPDILDRHGWRYLVYATDLPRALDRVPVVAEVDKAGRSAMVSLPSLGAVGLKSSALELIVDLVATSARDAHSPVEGDELIEALRLSRLVSRAGLKKGVHYLVRPGPTARLRQVSGMVRANRPGRLITALGGGIAAGMASGGFGVFFGSIWSLSVALSPVRHVLIAAIMIVTFTLWLITSNKLWFRDRAATASGRALVENIATFVTVLLSIIAFFAVLFAALGLLSLIVIDVDFLAGHLGYAPGPWDYIAITSLSVSMGMLAGALGSNFDDAEAVRIATYSKRGQEEREKLDQYRDKEDEQQDQEDQDEQADREDKHSENRSDPEAPRTSEGHRRAQEDRDRRH